MTARRAVPWSHSPEMERNSAGELRLPTKPSSFVTDVRPLPTALPLGALCGHPGTAPHSLARRCTTAATAL